MKRQTKIASFFAKPGEAARAPSTVLADKDSNLKPLQLKAQPNEICKITAPAIPAKKSAANVLLDSDIESETCTDPVDPPLSLSRKKAKTSSEDPDIADVIAAVVPKLSDTAQTDAKPISYDDLCQTFCKIEETTKRLQILAYLTDFFVRVIQRSPEILIDSVYLCLNRIGPEYEAKELGIGESLLMKAVALASGRSLKAIKADVDEKGDLGLVAQASKGNQKLMHKPKALTIRSVFLSLQEISNMSGNSSQSRKIALINKLLVSCTSNEPKYLIRSLEGKLRIGLAQQTILMALAHAVAITDPDFPKGKEKQVSVLAESVSIVKQVYSEMPSYDLIIPALLKYGWRALPDHCQLTPGIPLKPMLAHPTKSLTEVLNRFEGMEFTCEYKYDGERAQIHQLDDGRVMVYSRNSENLSDKYPDIIQRMAKVSGSKLDTPRKFKVVCP